MGFADGRVLEAGEGRGEDVGGVGNNVMTMRPDIRSSDLHWLGDVPVDWNARRIKRVMSRVDYGISVRTEQEGRFPVLKMGHIQSGEINFFDLDFVDEVSEDLLLETGDLLYNRTNSPDEVGKAAVFRGSKRDQVTFASYLVRLRTNHQANPHFLNYLLNSEGFLTYARKLAIPSVQQSNLNSTRYCRIPIPIPPSTEQQRIAAYLDASCAAIDAAVAAKRRQLETLDELRKSIIYRAVTKGLNSDVPRRPSGVAWFDEIPRHWRCEHLKRFTTRIQAGMTPPTNTPEYYMDGTIPWFAPGSFDGDIDLREPRKLINELARRDGELRIFPVDGFPRRHRCDHREDRLGVGGGVMQSATCRHRLQSSDAKPLPRLPIQDLRRRDSWHRDGNDTANFRPSENRLPANASTSPR